MAKRKMLIETRDSSRNAEAMTQTHRAACEKATGLITEALLALEGAGMRGSVSFHASSREFDLSVTRAGRTS